MTAAMPMCGVLFLPRGKLDNFSFVLLFHLFVFYFFHTENTKRAVMVNQLIGLLSLGVKFKTRHCMCVYASVCLWFCFCCVWVTASVDMYSYLTFLLSNE